MKVLVTGGAGFIGSRFVEMALSPEFPEIEKVTVLDKLTYAGNLDNLDAVLKNPNFQFNEGDICDSSLVKKLISDCDAVVNFAAESHVDRSIEDSTSFIVSNVLGTQVLLEAVRNSEVKRFLQVSTDEVYGSISTGSWDEKFPLQPNSPYSASKASSDLLTLAYAKTFNLDVLITRCSNNFGPRQHIEKLIPNMISKLIKNEPVTLYGDGKNIRDWLYVDDHCRAIYLVLTKGVANNVYNIGGGTELTNFQLAKHVIGILGKSESEIEFIKDRPGHDFRYSVNYDKLANLGYSPKSDFKCKLRETVDWYLKILS